ncbi:MAG: DNA primase [Geobacter sp.]|nr:DNA primase [Geobacter sp.]
MTNIPDDKVREVRERASILDVVSEQVSLKRSGSNWLGLCPFHQEKTPSFNVNPAKGIFHCFGCGVGGDAIDFVMKLEGLSFPEAVNFLAKRVGVQIEDRPQSATEKRHADERELFYRVCELACNYFRRVLTDEPAGEPGRGYLERRGVTQEIAAAYRLGFATDRWDGLVRFLEGKRVPLELAAKLGLVRKKESGGWYDLFRNRLLFTIRDVHGRPIAFGGRVLDDSLPKYINSPESPIYHKSDVLFGIDLAKQAMREQGGALIVEGYFDHLALYQAGVRNVVATCGTALTTGHIQLLRRYAAKAYALFDADKAGKKATFRAMELFLEAGFPAAVVELAAGEDPDSFVRTHGITAFGQRLEQAQPIIEYFFRDLLKTRDMRGVEGKVRVIEELTPVLLKIGNSIERDLYVREISRVLGVDEGLLRARLGRRPIAAADLVAPRTAGRKPAAGPEEMLLMLMGKFPDVARKVAEHGVESLFSIDLLPIARSVLAMMTETGEPDWTRVLAQAGSEEERQRLAALLVDDAHLEEIDANRAFNDCRLSREKSALVEMKELKRQLAQLDSESAEYWQILKMLDNLRNKKSQLH